MVANCHCPAVGPSGGAARCRPSRPRCSRGARPDGDDGDRDVGAGGELPALARPLLEFVASRVRRATGVTTEAVEDRRGTFLGLLIRVGSTAAANQGDAALADSEGFEGFEVFVRESRRWDT